jgi:hypothetical protein
MNTKSTQMFLTLAIAFCTVTAVAQTSANVNAALTKDSLVVTFPKDASGKEIREIPYDGKTHAVAVADTTKQGRKLSPVTVKYNGNKNAPSDPDTYAVTVAIGTGADSVNISLGTLVILAPPQPPIIPRVVILPQVTVPGVKISAVPGGNPVNTGSNIIKSGSNFQFIIEGSKVIPNVTYVRLSGTEEEKAEVKKNDNGSYLITIPHVQSNITVKINVTTGNAEIGGTQIWSSGGQLYITSSQSGEARIYNLTGTQVKTLVLTSGATVSETLATGLYIVTMEGQSRKIHVQ